MTAERGPIDLALGILDHQIVDSEGRRCGKVDDLELELREAMEPRVVAIVVGPGAWRRRGRIGRLAAWLARSDREVRIPWEEVAEVGAGVFLRRAASELGLDRGEAAAAGLIERIPGSGR